MMEEFVIAVSKRHITVKPGSVGLDVFHRSMGAAAARRQRKIIYAAYRRDDEVTCSIGLDARGLSYKNLD